MCYLVPFSSLSDNEIAVNSGVYIDYSSAECDYGMERVQAPGFRLDTINKRVQESKCKPVLNT